jgi:hypothetical protein
MTKDDELQSMGILSVRMRCLIIVAAGFVLSVTLVGAGGALMEPSLLILGATVQPRSPKPGRWLIWATAFLMSAWTLWIDAVVLHEFINSIPESFRTGNTKIFIGIVILAQVVLVVWCDVALIIEAARQRTRHALSSPSSRRSLDWLVWTAAIALNSYYAWLLPGSAQAYRLYRWYEVLVGFIDISVALALDAALVTHAMKKRIRR